MSIRIGSVPYGVGATLIEGLDARSGVELVLDAPSKLIRELRGGKLDAALLSSIEGFRRPGYRAAAGIGICSRGAVRSVRAFRRTDTALRTVGVDDASETSNALLRILLAQRFPDAKPEFERIDATTEPDALPHDLVMLIGDCGLAADPGNREVIDLGQAWFDWTGLPFVFALWLIAPGAPLEPLLEELSRAKTLGERSDIDDGTGGAVYHDVGAAELEGLRRFHAEAAALGLADAAHDIEFVAAPYSSSAMQ